MSEAHVPGAWRCPQCGFHLQQVAFSAVTGAFGVPKSDAPERCPNDGAVMGRVSWRQQAEEAQESYSRLLNDLCHATGTDSLPAAMATIRQWRLAQPSSLSLH